MSKYTMGNQFSACDEAYKLLLPESDRHRVEQYNAVLDVCQAADRDRATLRARVEELEAFVAHVKETGDYALWAQAIALLEKKP